MKWEIIVKLITVAVGGYVFRNSTSLEKLTLGDNCRFIGTYPFRYGGAETLEITCGKNTSIYTGSMSTSSKKILNVQNATFDYLYLNGNGNINGTLEINKGGTAFCSDCAINGDLIINDNVTINSLRGTTITGYATIGNGVKITGETTFYNFKSPYEIRVKPLITTTAYAQLQNCKILPSVVEIDKTAEGIGRYCFGGTDVEYLVINPNASFKCREWIFYQNSKIKAVVVNLSEEWTKDDFLSSIGVNINSAWLDRLPTGSFKSTPVEDTENNRLIYYSTNLTTDSSQVLELLSQVGL